MSTSFQLQGRGSAVFVPQANRPSNATRVTLRIAVWYVAAATALTAPMLVSTRAFAQVKTLTGPFVAGSGRWTDIPNGGFETGTTADFFNEASQNGTFAATNKVSYAGSYCAVTQTTVSSSTPDSAGYSLDQTLSGLTVGGTYVLSGFLILATLQLALFTSIWITTAPRRLWVLRFRRRRHSGSSCTMLSLLLLLRSRFAWCVTAFVTSVRRATLTRSP